MEIYFPSFTEQTNYILTFLNNFVFILKISIVIKKLYSKVYDRPPKALWIATDEPDDGLNAVGNIETYRAGTF
jgi:hypothetical protein